MATTTADRRDDTLTEPTAAGPAPRTASPRFRLALAAVLALALLASIAWLAVAFAHRPAEATASRQDTRATVMLRAKEWMGAFGSYTPRDLDDKKVLTAYRERVQPLITTGFTCGGVTFEEYAAALDRQVAAQKFSMSTSVERTGVESVDDDSATVILSGQVSGGQAGKELAPRDFQMLVDLQKIDGSWRIAKCNDVKSRFTS